MFVLHLKVVCFIVVLVKIFFNSEPKGGGFPLDSYLAIFLCHFIRLTAARDDR